MGSGGPAGQRSVILFVVQILAHDRKQGYFCRGEVPDFRGIAAPQGMCDPIWKSGFFAMLLAFGGAWQFLIAIDDGTGRPPGAAYLTIRNAGDAARAMDRRWGVSEGAEFLLGLCVILRERSRDV